MKKVAERAGRSGVRWAALVGLMAGGMLPLPAVAALPPLEFGLKATGAEAKERRELQWQLDRAGEGGLRSFRGSKTETGELVCEGDGERLGFGPESAGIWRYVWAVLWADEPGRVFRGWQQGESGRVEIVGGEPGFCYGEESRICLDEELRQVLLVSVVEEGKSWEIRVSQEGRALQVSLDGGLYARFRGREAR